MHSLTAKFAQMTSQKLAQEVVKTSADCVLSSKGEQVILPVCYWNESGSVVPHGAKSGGCLKSGSAPELALSCEMTAQFGQARLAFKLKLSLRDFVNGAKSLTKQLM